MNNLCDLNNLNIVIVEDNIEIKNKVQKFLNNLESISSVESNLVENGVAIKDDENNIYGFITYENYNEYGLIRYFIFQKQIEIDYIYQMFKELCIVAKQRGYHALISIGKNQEVINLFTDLDFKVIDKTNFLIGGKTIIGTDLESASILKYDL